ncbi:MAG TPA: alcohol dehydrogenase catalytic domain-containing protein, partial [Miltoncostaeaceae bacterium]|nr:alcohol dehydrogenase catalytic domain-containing protein [Miltoncostaeaceae bacterium]
MRALIVPEPGAAPEPAEVPEPQSEPGRSLVRVRAASLNPVDLAIAAGRFYMDVPDPPYVPGAEAAGEIVDSLAHPSGTPVWCLAMTGSLAEVVSV